MIIGTLHITIHLQAVHSLKQKRSIIKSLIGRLQSRFNASVSEVEAQDNKQLAIIGIGVVTSESRFTETQLDKILNFIHNDPRFYTGRINREIFYSNE